MILYSLPTHNSRVLNLLRFKFEIIQLIQNHKSVLIFIFGEKRLESSSIPCIINNNMVWLGESCLICVILRTTVLPPMLQQMVLTLFVAKMKYVASN